MVLVVLVVWGVNEINNFRNSFKPATTTEVKFKQSSATFNNPLTGLVVWANNPYEIQQFHTLAYMPVYWSEIEKNKGEYDFEEIEEKNHFKYWGSKEINTKIIIRFICDYPVQSEKHMDIPQWLYDETGDGTFYDTPYGRGYSPNYENPKFIEYHKKAIEALAERYDKNNTIAYIEMGSLGHYGEWHTYKGSDIKPFPKKNIAEQYAQHYVDSFKNKKLLMRRGYDIAAKNNIGLYNDLLGQQAGTDSWISWFTDGYTSAETDEKFPAMKDFWKTSPSGGELASDVNMENLFGIQYPKLKEMIQNSHTSFLGPNSPAYLKTEDQAQLNVNDLIKTMGYRFIANKAKYNDNIKKDGQLKVEIEIENLNAVPFYYNWKLNYYLIDSQNKTKKRIESDLDITKLISSKVTDKVTIKTDVPRGTYALVCGLVNPDTDEPEVHFANFEMDGRCFLTIGYLNVF